MGIARELSSGSDSSDDSDSSRKKKKKNKKEKKRRKKEKKDKKEKLREKIKEKKEEKKNKVYDPVTQKGRNDDSDEWEEVAQDPERIKQMMMEDLTKNLNKPTAAKKGPGDWDCVGCGNWNFVKRPECFKCRVPKGKAKPHKPVKSFEFIPIQPLKQKEVANKKKS